MVLGNSLCRKTRIAAPALDRSASEERDTSSIDLRASTPSLLDRLRFALAWNRPTRSFAKLRRFATAGIIAGFAQLSVLPALAADFSIQLRDVTKQTGIAFKHTDGSSGKHYIVEYVCAGLALLDYDGDGDEDIYFLNGAALPGMPPSEIPPSEINAAKRPRNALYRNDGNFKFTDVTQEAGVGDEGHGLGVAVGDYDNDGDLDLYLNNFGPNVLYQNNGDGTFTDATDKAGVENGRKAGAGANFLDIDGDGDLDLFVSNYVMFSYDKHVGGKVRGMGLYASPKAYKPFPDTLYRNNGDGTFTDISDESGIGKSAGPGMGTVCADFDDDGDTDIFVGNDLAVNYLFVNDGRGKFTEMGLLSGAGYDLDGRAQGTMGAACGDYDNDGKLDLYVTSYARELATLYRNTGGGFFDDVTRLSGAGLGTLRNVTWGNALVDFDNDGDRDIFVACGHFDANEEKVDRMASYRAKNVLLMNDGKGKFVDASDRCGDGMAVRRSSRGAAFDDLDGDGDVDVVILNSRSEPTVLRNDSAAGNHWLRVRLRGTKTNRDGVGARVKVVAGDLSQIAEVHSGHGYQSHFGMRLHFGLGRRERVDRIEVRWIGGGIDVLKNVAVDRVLTITEGEHAQP